MILLEILAFIGSYTLVIIVVCLIGKIGENNGTENVPDGKGVKMMTRTENECVGCCEIGQPCMGSACQNRNVTHLYCDNCGEEADELYDVYDDEICRDCLLDYFPKITID